MENKRLVHFLNQLLANYAVMYVKLHRYHWFVHGNHFYTLHETFENMYEMFHEEMDVIAERILMIKGKPYATMQKYLAETTLEEASADDQEEEIITQLRKDFRQLVDEIRGEGIPLASELADEPTLDLLIHLQGTLEKDLWMLRAYQSYEE